ncbi:MAG: hypothetical protein K2X45_08010 [Phreatobacter sp.]|nr:hypothetical protein [Phreatobacter sp.]
MGTRHLIAIALDGRYRLAQYGQWDGYPSGQGVGVLEFLRQQNMETFKEKVRLVRFINDEERDQLFERLLGRPRSKGASPEDVEAFNAAYQTLSRDAGHKILTMIANATEEVLALNNIDFAGDSLWCEYAYVIDLDLETFEVYKGGNTDAVLAHERFHGFPPSDNEEYQPVRLWQAWPLNALPSRTEFLEALPEG